MANHAHGLFALLLIAVRGLNGVSSVRNKQRNLLKYKVNNLTVQKIANLLKIQ